MAVKDLEKSIKEEEERIEVVEDDVIDNNIEASEEKENANEDVEAPVDSTKHDKYIKICSEIIEIKKKLGVVSMSDLSKIVGKEFFSNDTTSLFAIPGDKRYIEVLEILNNISSIVNKLSLGISLEELVKHLYHQFDKLDDISDDNQFNRVLEYLDSIKKSDPSKLIDIDELIKAFVIGKIIDNESERVFLAGTIIGTQILQFANLINVVNFDINDETQVNTCKSLLYSIKQGVSLNKSLNKWGFGYFTPENSKPFPFPNTMTINPLYGTGFDGINFEKANIIPGIDPKIYQKAAAYDKITEALKPFFIELMAQSKVF